MTRPTEQPARYSARISRLRQFIAIAKPQYGETDRTGVVQKLTDELAQIIRARRNVTKPVQS